MGMYTTIRNEAGEGSATYEELIKQAESLSEIGNRYAVGKPSGIWADGVAMVFTSAQRSAVAELITPDQYGSVLETLFGPDKPCEMVSYKPTGTFR